MSAKHPGSIRGVKTRAQIIHLLTTNGLLSVAELASELKLSKEATHKHLLALEEQKQITGSGSSPTRWHLPDVDPQYIDYVLLSKRPMVTPERRRYFEKVLNGVRTIPRTKPTSPAK